MGISSLQAAVEPPGGQVTFLLPGQVEVPWACRSAVSGRALQHSTCKVAQAMDVVAARGLGETLSNKGLNTCLVSLSKKLDTCTETSKTCGFQRACT